MRKIELSIEGKNFDLEYEKHFANLAKINESLNLAAAAHYQRNGLIFVDAPAIVGITGACENVDTLFKVQNRSDIPLFFNQTGQLSLEQALQSFPGVYTVIHSGRDEEDEDVRHLRQFRLTEEEFDCSFLGMTRNNYDEDEMFEAMLVHIQNVIRAIIRKILQGNTEILKKDYKRNIKFLEEACKTSFLRIEYGQAIKLLNKEGFKELSFGDDLKAIHEAKIVELLNNNSSQLPVFITKYPKEIKFFNMKVSLYNPSVVLSADLIFPFAGEGAGSAVREHDFNKLNERLISSNMYKLHLERGGQYDDFAWYLNIIKKQLTNPHAGYGIGNERVLQYIFGEKDIRNVSLLSLLGKQTGDWSKENYGRASIVSTQKRHILITVGKEDKRLLLPHIKKLASQENFILYATKKTHTFLQKNNVKTLQVFKISEIGKSPNIADLLGKRVFDLIINIPTHKGIKKSKEMTDGKLIRKGAHELGITLITQVVKAKEVIDNLSIQPFYDPKKTYQQNYEKGPFGPYSDKEYTDKGNPKYNLFGHKVYLPFGIPAGPLLNSNFVKYAFNQGFDIAVYKTVRTEFYPTHTFPNILSVKIDGQLTPEKWKEGLQTDMIYRKKMTITNSFGVPSKDPEVWQEDVKKALSYQRTGKVLILSFMGTVKEGQTELEFIQDYISAARLSAKTGASILETNLSCPNIGNEGLVCYNLDITEKIVKGIRKVIGKLPLILKIGYFQDNQNLEKFVAIIDMYADGIAAINTLQTDILDKFGSQALDGKMRQKSGVCGAAIKWAGIDMVRRLKKIRLRKHYSYKIIGVGGVITPEDYFDYKAAGADCVMSATGAMWNPNLAQEIKRKK